MSYAPIEEALAGQGWGVIDLPRPEPVLEARERLLARLRAGKLENLQRLDDYHLAIGDNEKHFATLADLCDFYWEADLGRRIVAENLDVFRWLIGADLHVQRYPYLRVVRPGAAGDEAPLHRDTYYGASPYELSAIVPFTDMEPDSAVRVISGSHLAPDRDYPFEQRQSPDVVPGSTKHRLGYPYAPRSLDPSLLARAEPVPLRVGQALLFGLSLVHGGGANRTGRTRVSTDIRVASSLAPVAWSRGVREDYFVPLCSSAVTRTARRYLAANHGPDGASD